MISGTVPLALCTVVFRRMFDTATGRIPPLPVSSAVSLPAMCMYSGAVSTILLCLYKHLKRGTLVNVGCSRQKCCSSTKNITQREYETRFSIKKLDDLNDSKKSLFEGCGDNKNVHKRKKSRRFSVVKRLVRDANDSKIILGERKTRSGKIYNCVK